MSYRSLTNSRSVRLAAKERPPRQDKPKKKSKTELEAELKSKEEELSRLRADLLMIREQQKADYDRAQKYREALQEYHNIHTADCGSPEEFRQRLQSVREKAAQALKEGAE